MKAIDFARYRLFFDEKCLSCGFVVLLIDYDAEGYFKQPTTRVFSLLKSGKVLSSRQPAWFLLCNPETSSRVTLALLGIAFQANLAYSCNSLDSCSLSPLTCFFLNTNDSNITNSVRSKISVLNSLRGSFAHAQNLSRIADATDFIFHGFSFLFLDLILIFLRLYGAGFLQLG